jgi:hypothetical protein
VTGLTTDFQANSENGGCMPAPEEVHVRFGSMAITRGAFHGTAHPSSATPTTDAIRGRFTTATKVTGAIGESYTITSLPPCHGTEPFSAQYVGPTAASAAPVLTSMRLHLVIAGSPFVNATYVFAGARETRISNFNPGTEQITLSYARGRKAR